MYPQSYKLNYIIIFSDYHPLKVTFSYNILVQALYGSKLMECIAEAHEVKTSRIAPPSLKLTPLNTDTFQNNMNYPSILSNHIFHDD